MPLRYESSFLLFPKWMIFNESMRGTGCCSNSNMFTCNFKVSICFIDNYFLKEFRFLRQRIIFLIRYVNRGEQAVAHHHLAYDRLILSQA